MNTNEMIDSNEAAEMDAAGIYIIEQPTVGQQIVGSLIAVAVPIAAYLAFAGTYTAVQAVRSKVQARRDRKAAEKAVVIVEESIEDTDNEE